MTLIYYSHLTGWMRLWDGHRVTLIPVWMSRSWMSESGQCRFHVSERESGNEGMWPVVVIHFYRHNIQEVSSDTCRPKISLISLGYFNGKHACGQSPLWCPLEGFLWIPVSFIVPGTWSHNYMRKTWENFLFQDISLCYKKHSFIQIKKMTARVY